MSNHTQNNDSIESVIKSYLSKLSPISAALIVSVALIILGLQPGKSLICQIDSSTSNLLQPQYNNRADYERLKVDMTLVEVESILGRGIEIERAQATATFIWKNHDGSSITAVFENGRLKSKYQSNLR